MKVPPPPSLGEMLEFYEKNWLSEGYESPEEEMSYKAYGKDILTKFWEIHSAGFCLPLATEQLFYIDIDGVKLRGYIDRVDKLPGGGLSIVDYKTNRDLFTTEHLANDLQLTLYQLAAEQLWQLPVRQLTLYHLRSNTPCTCPPRDQTQLEQARKLVLEVAENIARGSFPAVENQHCPCDFPEYCPYHRHQYLIAGANSAQQETLPAVITADTVEKYATLQKQLKDLQSQLDEVRQSIITFCQAQGINRVYGTEHAITYKLAERAGFDEGAVRSLLEQAGLWEKVLSFDPALVKKLLTDEEVAKSIRRELETLRRITSTTPQLWVRKLAGEEE